jgi:hypothetical protein
VAYDQRVREKARSKPELIAGIKVIHQPELVSLATLAFGAFLRCSLLGCDKNELLLINSAATNVSMAQASAAKIAEAELIRTATLPHGRNERR